MATMGIGLVPMPFFFDEWLKAATLLPSDIPSPCEANALTLSQAARWSRISKQ